MIITCPRCATRYLLEAGVVRPPGRQVRCARCQHMWFQEPAPDLPTPIPVPVDEPELVGPMTDKSRMLPPPPSEPPSIPQFDVPPPSQHYEPLDGPHDPMGPAQKTRRSARTRGIAGLLVVLAAVAAFLLLFLSIPNEIVKIWPESASLYNAVGIEVNKVGFSIKATQTQEFANSIPIVVIKGQVINETDRELEVPRIRLAFRNAAKKELFYRIVRADQDRLGPHAQGSFSANLESPPPDASDVEIRFARDDER